MSEITIRNVQALCTAPEGTDLVIVRVDTSEPELYGYGCATFTQRAEAVAVAVNRYLRPLLVGRDVSRISDLWKLMTANAYWRNGPVTNNSVAGVDMALWDIAGKRAGMPVFQLLGGAMRDRIEVYRHADGSDPEALIESAQRLVEAGHRYVRCQIAGYGAVGAMTRSGDATSSKGNRIDPRTYIRATIAALEAVRERLGDDIELLHDVHERIEPIEALGLARELERFRLFFLEDAVAIEQLGWLRQLRAHSATPLAIGELFTSIDQWLPLMQDRLIDFIRVHLSDVGGITPALRLSRVAEAYGVRTAFHGPGDLSPFGHAANVHLDFALPNFGIQEMYEPSTRMAELFPGMLEVREGAVDLPTRPGLGVDVDEEALAAFECRFEPPSWTEVRKPDGGLVWP